MRLAMSPIARWRGFWGELAARERVLIGVGLLVLLPVGFYLYVWQPVTAERARLAVRVDQLRGELARLRADSEAVKRMRGQPPISTGDTLENAARQAAARFGLAIAPEALTAQGGDRLLVNLNGVAFDAWVRWLGELGAQGVSLLSCKVEALPEPGQVRVKATLARAAS
jgi:type II secretory pathway component PulM